MSILAGILIQRGALTSESEGEFIAAGVALLVPLLWSLWQKFNKEKEITKALELPSGSSRKALDFRMKWDE